MLDTNVLWFSTVGRTFLTLITLGSGRNGWSNKPEESSQSQSAYIHIEIMQFTNLSIICISCGLTCLSIFSPPIWKVGKVWVAFVTFFSLCKAVPILMCTWPFFYNVIPMWVMSKSKEWVFQSPSAIRHTLSVLTVKPLKHGECSLCLHGRKWTTISQLSWWSPYQIWKPDSMGIRYYLCAIKALPLL